MFLIGFRIAMWVIMIIFAAAMVMGMDCCPVALKRIAFADDKREDSKEGNLHMAAAWDLAQTLHCPCHYGG